MACSGHRAEPGHGDFDQPVNSLRRRQTGCRFEGVKAERGEFIRGYVPPEYPGFRTLAQQVGQKSGQVPRFCAHMGTLVQANGILCSVPGMGEEGVSLQHGLKLLAGAPGPVPDSAVATFLVLATTGLASTDAGLVRAAYLGMNPIGLDGDLPAQPGLPGYRPRPEPGHRLGSFRHYRVLIKLLITTVASALLLVHLRPVTAMAEIAASSNLDSADTTGMRVQLVFDAGAALLALLITTVLRFGPILPDRTYPCDPKKVTRGPRSRRLSNRCCEDGHHQPTMPAGTLVLAWLAALPMPGFAPGRQPSTQLCNASRSRLDLNNCTAESRNQHRRTLNVKIGTDPPRTPLLAAGQRERDQEDVQSHDEAGADGSGDFQGQ
ncbi:UNVERIFIED_ORG: hypothetical protein ABIB52_000570 [Arthrobacter sp. UYCu721]